ncbi:MAG TPA: phosphatase PAP2 family protein [Verrucomicrobiae bacterium]|nr:phosphatase PAP2 family protein [Verrucomicrobiae bacterium]
MPTFVFIAILIAVTPLLVFTGADLAVSSLFYTVQGGWAYGSDQPWQFLYDFGPWPCYVIGGVSLALLLYSPFRPQLARFRRSALYLLLVLLIGPGLLVNVLFKDHWGRPRPRQVSAFGGEAAYLPPWKKGETSEERRRSFPSGHASSGFYLAAPYFLLRRTDRRSARRFLCGGIVLGGLIGVARIAQGGHFLTDVLWAAGFVFLTAELVYQAMFRGAAPEPLSIPAQQEGAAR